MIILVGSVLREGFKIDISNVLISANNRNMIKVTLVKSYMLLKPNS